MAGKWKLAVAALAMMVCGTIFWLKFFPPLLLRVAAGYSSKIVCTNVFMTGRDAAEVLNDDVQAPGHPLLKLMQVDVDREKGLIRANLFGLFGRGLAVYRPGTGCAALPDGDIETAKKYQFTPTPIPRPPDGLFWPLGSLAQTNRQIEQIIQNDELAGPGARGIVVIHENQLVAQRYGKGFNERTPLLGWSMTKSVTAILVGMQVKSGRLRLDQAGFWPPSNPADERQKITLSDLLSMTSGLHFNEDYGDVSDVTRMLYAEGDMAAFVRSQPLQHPPGSSWSYSTGTSVLLSQLWQSAAGRDALSVPRRQLFTPLGMSSAFMEADQHGTIVGGSYMYATAHDWGRIGQFLLQDGSWNGRQLLGQDYVAMMKRPAAASGGIYSQGQLWLEGPFGDNPHGALPGPSFQLPADTFWLQGHDGQSIAIVPSKKLVVVRLGLTPEKLHYKPQAMLAEILKTLP